MIRCPNCNYPLVLLSHRQKYKCAKCSKIYPQKQIEVEEFRKNNERQRQIDKENYNQSKTQEKIQQKQLSRNFRFLFNPPKTRKEIYRENRKVLLYNKKIKRLNNLETHKRNDRIIWWRCQQKTLAVEMLNNHFFEIVTNQKV